MKSVTAFLLGVAIFTLVSLPAHAAVIYVDDTAMGANDGSSWMDAFTDLQSAIAVALDSDQIWVAAGIYYPTSMPDRFATFDLSNVGEIYGGFAGWETDLSERDLSMNESILSGDIGGPGLPFDNSYHVIIKL